MFSFRLGSRYSGECLVSGWVLGTQERVQFQAEF